MSRYNEEFMAFALKSPAAHIAAKMMRLDDVRFFYDQLFIKEPGTLAPTVWHHDLPFWPFVEIISPLSGSRAPQFLRKRAV